MRLQASQALAKWVHVVHWIWCVHECGGLLETIGVDVLMPRRTDETCGASRRHESVDNPIRLLSGPLILALLFASWFHPPLEPRRISPDSPAALPSRCRCQGRTQGWPVSGPAEPHIALSFVGRSDWHPLSSLSRADSMLGTFRRHRRHAQCSSTVYAVELYRRYGFNVCSSSVHLPSSASRVRGLGLRQTCHASAGLLGDTFFPPLHVRTPRRDGEHDMWMSRIDARHASQTSPSRKPQAK
ncbi:hypothetical protein K491DRAFT_455865 [Lophiostoma macrostomum CBS 122681]|uniref:Uncharacterized protein n=1 Tax=Lophiostoma macrostomum CBS 122681 TaxID=1314788 RepID=A0A6A6T4T1_9PLEO|nr:hypothetical protein K491DRAFT_455865 [Lophiostoma macrostomum CBS 122681]